MVGKGGRAEGPARVADAGRPRGGSTLGRPRDRTLDDRVLAAVLESLQTLGSESTTIEGIARRAGVARSTIYRRWPSRGVLMADALLRFVADRTVLPDTGSLHADLVQLLNTQRQLLDSPAGHCLIELMLDARNDDALRELLRPVVQRSRLPLRAVLDRGARRGELGGDVQVDRAIDLVSGAIWLRVLTSLPMTKATVRQLVDCMFPGLAPAKA